MVFAYKHRWWGTSEYAAIREGGGDWRKVIWNDKVIFDIGKDGKIWVIHRIDEKYCLDYIKFIYRSGKFFLIIWGVLE